MNIEEKLYTSTEVAEVLGVSLRSVYRYLEQGKLEAEIKTATGRLRFTKKNITDFLYPSGGARPRSDLEPNASYSVDSQVVEEGAKVTDSSVDTTLADRVSEIGATVKAPRVQEMVEKAPVIEPTPEPEMPKKANLSLHSALPRHLRKKTLLVF